MEYIDGGTLKDKMDADEITTSLAVTYIQDILEGLSYVHDLDMVHRDLKPSNIMFKTLKNKRTGRLTETLKIIDFGLVADTTDLTLNSLMQDKCGTIGYLAPELINKKGYDPSDQYDTKVDIFSAGILFFEMINKRNPFKGQDTKKTLHKNMRCNINLIGMAGSCENYFIMFLKSLISTNPENRYSAQQALAHDIFTQEIYNEGESNILSSKFERILPQRRLPKSKGHYDELHSYKNFEDKFKESKSLRKALGRNSRNLSSRHINSKGDVLHEDEVDNSLKKSSFVFDLGKDQANNSSNNHSVSRRLTLKGESTSRISVNHPPRPRKSKKPPLVVRAKDEAEINFDYESSESALEKRVKFDEDTQIQEYFNRYKVL